MKYLNYLLAVLCIAIAPLMTSCDKDSDDQPTTVSIIGSWQQTNDAGTVITVVFNKNTSGTVSFKYENGDSSIENFSYSYGESGGDKWVTIIDSSLEGEYDVVLTATKLRLEFYRNGDRRFYEFKRI